MKIGKMLGFLVATILASSAFVVTEVVADDWSGPYVGLQAGYNWGDADAEAYNAGEEEWPVALNGFDLYGFVGGIFAGYNWRVGNDVLLGVEGEGNWGSIDDTITKDGGTWGAKVEQNWDASLRLRAGVAMGDYMPYMTVGIAWADVESQGYTNWDYEDAHDATLTGWTIGAGVEKKINNNLDARIQYRYSDYGDETWYIPIGDYDTGKIQYTAHMFTVGLSYNF
jgi:outer membrane immunogenic protein